MSDWVSGNYYLGAADQENNAAIIAATFSWWSPNGLAAILGNMQAESTINPGIWEGLNEGNLSGGFGLVQWTPATKFLDWSGGDQSGDAQLQRIQYEIANGIQWGATQQFPLSFTEFTTSDKPPGYLAAAFMLNYERPADQSWKAQQGRADNAERWYTWLTGLPAPPWSAFPIWLFFKMTRRR